MAIISVPQKQLEIEVDQGANLMESLLKAGLPVASSCNGDGVCGKCRMRLTPKKGAASEVQELEFFLIQKYQLSQIERIACQVSVLEDLTVETTYW